MNFPTVKMDASSFASYDKNTLLCMMEQIKRAIEMQGEKENGVDGVDDDNTLTEPNGQISTNAGANVQTPNDVIEIDDDSALGEPNERTGTNADAKMQEETINDVPIGAEMLSEHLVHHVDDDDDNDSGFGDIEQKKAPKNTKTTWFPLEIFDTENELYDFMKKEYFSKKKSSTRARLPQIRC